MNNTEFSFVTHVTITNRNGTTGNREELRAPSLAFSADGTKFAAGTDDGVVSVWDVQSKIPLKVFEVDMPGDLQFSSGIFGRELLAFVEVS